MDAIASNNARSIQVKAHPNAAFGLNHYLYSRGENTQMAKLWSAPVGSANSDALSYWDYFGGKLVKYASISQRAKVLDAGCGNGSSLFKAAREAGPKGHVVGIDICTCPR